MPTRPRSRGAWPPPRMRRNSARPSARRAATVFADPKQVVAWTALAFGVFGQSPAFAPFDSRYDRWLAGRGTLSAAERRGLALYRDADKGNCDTCHPSRRAGNGRAPLFTDAGFIAIGAPRRPDLPDLAGSSPFLAVASQARGAEADLGLCRSGRTGLDDDPSFCGRFRTPTLRNVALRTSFFHNGSVHSLRDAVAFYATRDTDPARWYRRGADGAVQAYDDLPAASVPYVDREVPFQPLPDGRARLDDQEIDDLVAFLRTLTDADAATGADAR